MEQTEPEKVANVVRLGDVRSERSGSAMDWQPIELLETLVDDLKAGRVKIDRLLVIKVEDGPGDSNTEKVTWAQAKMTRGEMYLYLGRTMSDIE